MNWNGSANGSHIRLFNTKTFKWKALRHRNVLLIYSFVQKKVKNDEKHRSSSTLSRREAMDLRLGSPLVELSLAADRTR